MKMLRRFLSLDDALFIMILAVPCVLAVAVDVATVTEKATIILAHRPVKDVDGKLTAQAKSDVTRPGTQVR